MSEPEQDVLETARRYLRAIEEGATGDALAGFFDPDVIQKEFPNRLVPDGTRRDLAALLETAVRGQQVVQSQRFDVVHAVVDGDHVALEVDWSAVLAVPVGTLAAGGTMRAHFAVFLDFRDGK